MRKRTSALVGATIALATIALAIPGSAAIVSHPLEDGLLEWTSADAGGSGGRETPAMSADGRWVVFVGRGEGKGVWAVDRRTDTTRRLTTGDDFDPDVSDNGRFVVYAQRGGEQDVYLLDRDTDKDGAFDEVGATSTVSASVDNDGNSASGPATAPALSGNGRYVAFQVKDNLDGTPACKTGGGPDKVHVYDRVTRTVEMVSVAQDAGGESCAVNGNAQFPSITPDGRFVTFTSDASVLMPAVATLAEPGEEEEEPTVPQVFVRDRQAATTSMVSVGVDDLPGDGASAFDRGATISDNGRKVAFESDATNLVAGDTNANTDAFVRDLQAATTMRVSVDENGAQVILAPLTEDPCGTAAPVETEAEEPGEPALPVAGGGPAIAGDGGFVAFESEAPLTSDDANEVDGVRVRDVYGYDVAAQSLQRVSVAIPGGVEASGCRTEGHTGANVPAVNGVDAQSGYDGRTVVFMSQGDPTLERPSEEEPHESASDAEVAAATAFEAGIFTRTLSLPTLASVRPAQLTQGFTGTVTLTGGQFTPPGSAAALTVTMGTGISVTNVAWLSPTSIKVTLTVATNAALGARKVTVVDSAGDKATCAGCVVVTERVRPAGSTDSYRLVGSDGGVFTFGTASFHGSMGGARLNAPVVAMVETASGRGYYLVASDGGVFAFGDAEFEGSLGGTRLNRPIVDIAIGEGGKGYVLVASDGGVFAFGTPFRGSLGADPPNAPIVAIDTTSAGYRLVGADGGVFTFGNASFQGSLGGRHLNAPIVDITDRAGGYWLVSRDGGVFTFGSAGFYGSAAASPPAGGVVGIVAVRAGTGYRLTSERGAVRSFGTASNLGALSVTTAAPITGMSR
jgi:Tol biopolymer transport system component